MRDLRHLPVLCLLAAWLVTSCAPQTSTQPPAGQQEPKALAPKRLTAAIMAELHSLGPGAGKGPGKGSIEGLMHAGLADFDETNTLRAKLAEAVPVVENGLWRVFPDGRMATTWKIRPGAQWHDGTPFTSEDLLFTANIEQNRELAAFRKIAYQWVETVEAPDARTVVVHWKRPYIEADRMFAFPYPKHVLQGPAVEAPEVLIEHGYWNVDFVGLGPFKLGRWDLGSHVALVANDTYVLGRPKLDEVVVKFIADSNTLVANILAGSVDLPLGRGLSVEQALLIRDQWKDGRVEVMPRNWVTIYPQFAYSNPPVVKDVHFRRALMHAIDRQEMVATLEHGYGGVAHSILTPGQPQFQQVEARLPQYEYDPRKAARMIEDLGYIRGPGGSFQDASGQKLHFEIRAVPTDLSSRATLTVVNYWQRAGIAAEAVLMSPAQQRNEEHRALFPAFEMVRNPNDIDALRNFHSSRLRTRENNWIGSHTGYQNAEYDALYEKYLVTVPIHERNDIVGRMVHHIADQLVAMGLFYDTLAVLVGNRTVNFKAGSVEGSDQVWSAHEWDLRN